MAAALVGATPRLMCSYSCASRSISSVSAAWVGILDPSGILERLSQQLRLASRVDLENVSTAVGRHCHLDASVRRSGHEIRDRHAVQGH
jgi:hypothetical protein